eukprot:TRINITY_DN6840_c0_g1_i1.p1 TRINITY_DN6840_c0_g1~~TRINITY_DN6840_c0_g1_i1.p1  ORF type:complete len:486 (+),score=77.29 TRINITY_DN6840_c0_g1_i1:46-1503(+)
MEQSHASLLKASRNGDFALVEKLLETRCDPNFQSDITGTSALHRASICGHLEIVRVLLDARASVWLRDASGGSVLDVTRPHNPNSALLELLEEAAMTQQDCFRHVEELKGPLALLTVAYGEDAGRAGHYTEGHTVLKERDLIEAVKSGSTLLYGELLPESASQLWRAFGVEHLQGGRLLEMGMGTGKVALQAFVENPQLSRVFGIELAPSRYLVGEQALVRLAEAMPSRFEIGLLDPGNRIILVERVADDVPLSRELEFCCGDMLQVSSQEMASADVVCMEVCLPTSLHAAVCRKTGEMKLGAKLFCFADLVSIWTSVLSGQPCHLRHCGGADGTAHDRHYKTTWIRKDCEDDVGHPFFLMEVCSPSPLSTGTHISNDVNLAANPSNSRWLVDDEISRVVEFGKSALLSDEKIGLDVALVVGQSVEIARRYQLKGGVPAYERALVARVHDDGLSVDVIYFGAGDMEEFCDIRRVRAATSDHDEKT